MKTAVVDVLTRLICFLCSAANHTIVPKNKYSMTHKTTSMYRMFLILYFGFFKLRFQVETWNIQTGRRKYV